MKKLLFALLISLPSFIFAQTQGMIEYKETIAFEIDLPEEMKEMASQIPTSQSSNMVLAFNETSTLYEAAKTNETPQDLHMGSEDGGMQIKMKFEMPENKVYTDVSKGEVVQKQEFMGKKFLITGETKRYKWKPTGESEKILGYDCQKATYQVDSSQSYVAWFTPQIPVSAGPQGFSGLPGMILKLDRNDGEMVIEVTNVDLKELDKDAIKKPKKGKKVTREEFEKIQEEKMKEMEAEFGGGGNRIIIRN